MEKVALESDLTEMQQMPKTWGNCLTSWGANFLICKMWLISISSKISDK